MRSEIEIVDDIYKHIQASGMMDVLTGNLCKDEREEPYSDEDCVISVLSNELVDDVQEVNINVNVYVRDINVHGHWLRNRKRLGTLCATIRTALNVGGIGKEYTFHRGKQRVFEVSPNETTPEHYINQKLFYQIIDE